MNDPIEQFKEERKERVRSQGENDALKKTTSQFMAETMDAQYSYNFSWMGRPIIQYPQDMVAMQEILWELQPDLIIETGIAHGGSLIFYASILELIGKGEVLGIDVDIRKHNRDEIENHPMYKRITMLEGSSTSAEIIGKVKSFAEGKQTVLVVLDSNHTHQHVKEELDLYHEFVTPGSYLVVFDTVVEDLPKHFFGDRPWSVGDNPKTAVWEFMQSNDSFEVDRSVQDKLLITVAPDGYLKRKK